MESYLVDPAVLGDIVDALISEKYPDQPASDFASLRENAIRALDHQILKAIMGSLTREQGSELNQILDEKPTDSAVYEEFFAKHNIDLSEIIKEVMVKFKDDFMKGGENA